MQIFKQSTRRFFLPFSAFLFSTEAIPEPAVSSSPKRDFSALSAFQFNEQQINLLAKHASLAFESQEQQEIESKLSLLKRLLDLDEKQLKKIVLSAPKILDLKNEEIEQRVKSLKDALPFTDKEFRKLFFDYPPVLLKNPTEIASLIAMIKSFIMISDRNLAIAASRHAFLLGLDEKLMRANIVLLSKCGFTQKMLQEIVCFCKFT